MWPATLRLISVRRPLFKSKLHRLYAALPVLQATRPWPSGDTILNEHGLFGAFSYVYLRIIYYVSSYSQGAYADSIPVDSASIDSHCRRCRSKIVLGGRLDLHLAQLPFAKVNSDEPGNRIEIAFQPSFKKS